MTADLELVEACDNFPYDADTSAYFKVKLPFDDRIHGYMLPEIVQSMPWTPEFKIDHIKRVVQLVDCSNGHDTSTACNTAFSEVVTKAIEIDVFKIISGRHSEPFAIVGAKTPMQVERFAAPLFGFILRGAHMTVYTTESEDMRIWVPRRSGHLFTYPNMLDTTVAGGVAAHESPFENIVHEADEEASLPEELVRERARPCGVLTYMTQVGRSETFAESGLVHPDCIYVYDLEVNRSVIPKPRDEEVKEFYLMTVDEVKVALRRGEFKPNCALVMLDFFIRHGIITADNEKNYIEIIMRMHRRLPFPTAPHR
ncbi:putative thiamin pyrophosphokinase-related protein [Phaeomoniella chlamydospora]|uniref:Putative thiamin pyrophosphokinase-related protein n=1 Tax=Phaeomoniella chlamydospora TaxID=158046 RepID=A0A0G2EFH5_PHACM|nr:putative thiamin pyrophosphokinase-related protein [Phaeomoniella chlamydospora]